MTKMKAKELARRFEILLGDSSLDSPEEFEIEAINRCFNELPRIPKLDKLFTRHYTVTLDAKDHYKWNLNGDFRRLSNIPVLNFWTSTGGEPCKLDLCNRDNRSFFDKNGLPELRQPGTPCEYTLEKEGDEVYLVLDRPSDVPIIIDYICYGYPAPISSLEDEIDISAIAENLIISLMKSVHYSEAQDFAMAENLLEYLDNKAYREAIQELYKSFGVESKVIVGEA